MSIFLLPIKEALIYQRGGKEEASQSPEFKQVLDDLTSAADDLYRDLTKIGIRADSAKEIVLDQFYQELTTSKTPGEET